MFVKFKSNNKFINQHNGMIRVNSVPIFKNNCQRQKLINLNSLRLQTTLQTVPI